MTKLYALSLLLATTGAIAQPVLQSGSISYVPGESFVESICPWTGPGPAGAGQVWNFSTLVCPSNFTSNWEAPLATTLVHHPTATVSYHAQSYFGNYEANASAFKYLGFSEGISLTSAVYDDPADEIRYPFQFGDSYTDTFGGMSYFPDGSGAQASAPVSGTLFVHADAYGNLVLPWGTVENVIRLHKVRTSQALVEEEYRFHQPGVHHPWLRIYRRTNNGVVQTESTRYWQPVGAGIGEDLIALTQARYINGDLHLQTAPAIKIVSVELFGTDGRLQQAWSGADLNASPSMILPVKHPVIGLQLLRITDSSGRSTSSRLLFID